MLAEIDRKVDMTKLEETLMREGLAKFADPQKALLKLIAEKRAALLIVVSAWCECRVSNRPSRGSLPAGHLHSHRPLVLETRDAVGS